VKRILWILIAGSVLWGIAPQAMATDRGVDTDPPLKGPATAQDWAEFFEAVGELNATLASFEADSLAPVQHWRYDRCQFQSLMPGLWTPREERLSAKCAVRHWSVPGGLSQMLSVGQCESGWNRFSHSPLGYVGIFQHDEDSWAGRVATFEPGPHWDLSSQWTNSRSQVIVTARMAHNDGDWGQWAGCA